MTTFTDRAPMHAAAPQIQMQDMMAAFAAKARTFYAARKAAQLQKKTHLIVSGLDAHILRDIGLDPDIAATRARRRFDHRSGIHGLW